MEHTSSDVKRLVDFVVGLGRPDLSVAVMGCPSVEVAKAILGTGKVKSLYSVPGDGRYMPLTGDGREFRVTSSLSDAVASRAIPSMVDLAYIACDRYADAVFFARDAIGACDIVAGFRFSAPDVYRAVRDVFGRPPDSVVDGELWSVAADYFSQPAYSRGDAIREKFDRIMFLTCPQGVDRRVSGMMAEFRRLGVADMVLPYLNEHNVFAHMELDRRRFANDGARRNNVKNCLFGHYGMIRFARDAGFSRVLFTEDDCRFTIPAEDVDAYIRDMPDGANAAVDYIGVKEPVHSGLFGGDPSLMWAVLPKGIFFDNLTCYMLNRDGMDCLVDYFERCGTDGYRWPVDAADRIWPHLTSSMPVYIPRERFAVQNGGQSLINGVEV